MGREWIWSHLRYQPLAALAAVGVMVIVAVLVGSALSWQRGLERAANSGADSALTYLVARGSEDAVERSLIEVGNVEQASFSLAWGAAVHGIGAHGPGQRLKRPRHAPDLARGKPQ